VLGAEAVGGVLVEDNRMHGDGRHREPVRHDLIVQGQVLEAFGLDL
jgi:hypothetical protein